MNVYHLLSAEYGFDDIDKGRIKIARYSDSNDPFELLAANLSDKTIRRAVQGLKSEFQRTKGYISFSRSWRNPVLWSHYADKHKGLALGFKIPDRLASEMQYTHSRIPLTYERNNPAFGVSRVFAQRLIHTKYEHWDYEQEIRMHIGLDEGTEENGLYFMPFSEELQLLEVVLGHECPLTMRNLWEKLSAYNPPVRIIKGRLAFTTFTVTEDRRYAEKK